MRESGTNFQITSTKRRPPKEPIPQVGMKKIASEMKGRSAVYEGVALLKIAGHKFGSLEPRDAAKLAIDAGLKVSNRALPIIAMVISVWVYCMAILSIVMGLGPVIRLRTHDHGISWG